MRDDLLEAQAAVDWAIAQVPILQKRIAIWRRSRPYTVEIETESEPTEKRYRLTSINPLDSIIHAEIGVMIHSLRSSLDILACALAARNGYPESKSTHFPIWQSAADVANPKSRPWEFIKRLNQVDRDIIVKDLRPYAGGNDLLCFLHSLDLTRKHRRLLRTYVLPSRVHYMGEATSHVAWSTGAEFVWDDDYLKQKPVVISTAASLPDGDISVVMEIAFDEGNLSRRRDFSATFGEFARLARDIIGLFDEP